MSIAVVILDQALDRPLDYLIPEELREKARPGVRVAASLRGAPCKGTLFALKERSEYDKLVPLTAILSESSSIPSDLLELASWMVRYYCTPFHKVLKTISPPAVRKEKGEKKQLFITSMLSRNELAEQCTHLRSRFPKQALVLDSLLTAPKGLLLSELIEKAGVSRAPIDTLLEKKILDCRPLSSDFFLFTEHDYCPVPPKKLTEEQEKALKLIGNSLKEGCLKVHLLHGVTGSGKTEVYLQAIEQALQLNKTVIFLVPEISLTPQTVERFRSRFKQKIAILHSRMTDKERQQNWQAISAGKAEIVIGARSALFSPMARLGLIILDEEHDNSYKSETTPPYHAREVAIMRAKFVGATVVLGSATPCLESLHAAYAGKYIFSQLKNRVATAKLPTVKIIDMKEEYLKAKGFTLFSDALLGAIEKRFKLGEQTILLLNRRGYFTSQICLSCGKSATCPRCDVRLTFHRKTDHLSCHLCDFHLTPAPRHCLHCKESESIKYKGFGTEQVERKLNNLFPEMRLLRADTDTMRHRGSHEALFKQFRSGKSDLLIGTQMVAKGLHFPLVTLVGILNIDATLNIPDFRASEQTFQLVTQVAGRAGRGEFPGEVIIQTAHPDHPIIQLAARQDVELFYSNEIESRKLFAFPPFTHLVKLTISALSAQVAEQVALDLRELCINSLDPSFQILPVIPCGHPRIKERYRFQFLIKGERPPLLSFLEEINQKSSLRKEQAYIHIDINPTSTFL